MCFASPKPQLKMEMIVQFAFLQVSCDMFVLSFKLWSFGVCLFVFVFVVVFKLINQIWCYNYHVHKDSEIF